MKITTTAAVAAVAIASISYAAKPSDPVLMTVGGHDVGLSEFEYLYNKNKSQQEKPVSLDEYVNMFIDYKMKVLAAEAAGLDTARSFLADIDNFAAELAEPYLTDTAVTDSLALVTYSRMGTDVDVSHIMLGRDGRSDSEQTALLDSLRKVALSGAASFSDLADAYSTDPAVKRNHGHLGYIAPGLYPYEIEDMAYTLKPGEISEPFTTRFGRHIIKVTGSRPDPGKIKARHILKMYGTDTAATKHTIDSIYRVLLAGADFAEVAKRETEDPSGKQTGGDLPWFGSGQMVPEFEQAAFALADGELSKPVATAYGYHIIKREGSKSLGTYEQERPVIDKMMSRDYRSTLGRQRRLAELGSRLEQTTNTELLDRIKELGKTKNTATEIIAAINGDNPVVATVGDMQVLLSDILPSVPTHTTAANFPLTFERILADRKRDLVSRQARRLLERDNTEYANLLNEYHDGLLLYEISDAEVWGKANSDTEGLARYFNEHRTDYNWDKPRFKGFVLMATSDSIVNAARQLISDNPTMEADSLGRLIRRRFGNTARIEKVLAPQGANAIIDYVAFGGPRPAPTANWKAYAPVRSRIIAQPEDVNDVKGQVSVDYQKQLEKEWLDRLHRTYKVKVNEKVLRQVK